MKKFVADSKIQLSHAILVFRSSSFEICDFLFLKDKVFTPVDEIKKCLVIIIILHYNCISHILNQNLVKLQSIGGMTSKCHHTKYKTQPLALIAKKCKSTGAHTGKNNKMP